MKTLTAKELKKKKDNLHDQFNQEKAEAQKAQKQIDAWIKKRDSHIQKMNSYQSQFKILKELEQSLLPDTKKKATKKKKPKK